MLSGTDDKIRAAYRGYLAYFGTFEVNEEEAYVVHQIRHSLFPNWSGEPQKRFFESTDGGLLLSTPPTPFGNESVTGVLGWKRAT